MLDINEMWKKILQEEEWCVVLEEEIDRLKNDLCAQEEKLRKASNNRPTEREVVLARQVKDLTEQVLNLTNHQVTKGCGKEWVYEDHDIITKSILRQFTTEQLMNLHTLLRKRLGFIET